MSELTKHGWYDGQIGRIDIFNDGKLVRMNMLVEVDTVCLTKSDVISLARHFDLTPLDIWQAR